MLSFKDHDVVCQMRVLFLTTLEAIENPFGCYYIVVNKEIDSGIFNNFT